MNKVYWAVGLILVWGFPKVWWEGRIYGSYEKVVYGSVKPVSYEVRDGLGQGLMIAALGGYRGLAANLIWISLHEAWKEKNWSRVVANAEMAVLLQPRSIFFWENGGWHMAYNASIDAENDEEAEPNPTRRRMVSERWIGAAREFLKRGIAANPDRYQLYLRMAEVEYYRQKDYLTAHEFFLKAAKFPDAPYFIERMAGYSLENAGMWEEALEYWIGLWNGTSPEKRRELGRQWDLVERNIREAEKKLNIPEEKSFFAKR